MGVFAALVDNLGEAEPHLPLKEGMVNHDVFYLINLIYLTDIAQDPEGYAASQTFYGSDDKLRFEVICKETGNVLMTFVNRNSSKPIEEDKVLFLNEYIGPPLLLTKKEMEITDSVYQGTTYDPTKPPIDDFPFKLAKLLNDKNYIGYWLSGTMCDYSTAGLSMVYKGPGKDVPPEFPKDDSPYLVIIRTNQGKKKGYLCLRT